MKSCSIFRHPRPKDFNFDHHNPYAFNRKELIIRFLSIVVISLISPLLFFDFAFSSAHYAGLFLVALVRTTLLWHGSMVIINFWTYKYSIFEEPVRLLISQLISLAGFVFLVVMGEIYSTEWVTNIPLPSQAKTELMITTQLITFLISTIYASFGFFIQWKQNLLKAQLLEKANIEAQYESLKSQVNPHFLFNSLNTLLSIVQGNENAERYIENLSEFMRYILKNRERQGVSLKEELEVAAQYSFLQQSRFPRKLLITFEVPEFYQAKLMPPLTLQMLIENAIKHNEISSENTLSIKIYVDEVQNLVVENSVKKKIDSEPSTGIGLNNIRDRYMILSGKRIIIQEDQNKFSVLLPLN